MSDYIEISGRRRRTFVLSTSIANSGIIEAGGYDVYSDVDCAMTCDRATPDPAMTLATGYPLFANQVIPVRVGEGQAIYAIAGGAGNFYYIKTGE